MLKIGFKILKEHFMLLTRSENHPANTTDHDRGDCPMNTLWQVWAVQQLAP